MLAAKSRSSSTCRALPDAQASYRKYGIGLERASADVIIRMEKRATSEGSSRSSTGHQA
jgi:hypothetical protein